MKKIFIDCGGNTGQGLRQFIKMFNIDSSWHVETFEPDPSCEIEKHIQDLEYVKINKKAVWDKNGTIKFYQFLMNSQASSVEGLLDSGYFQDPKHDFYLKKDNMQKVIEVECIDISQVIKQFSDDDFIVVKIDTEGSEFTILRKLIKDNIIKKINHLYVEWHTPLLSTENDQSEHILKQKILDFGVNLHDWH